MTIRRIILMRAFGLHPLQHSFFPVETVVHIYHCCIVEGHTINKWIIGNEKRQWRTGKMVRRLDYIKSIPGDFSNINNNDDNDIKR